ncbi:MAG: YceI family protein [Myxococcota bacterium]
MIVSLMALLGCIEDVGKDKVQAKVEDVPEAAQKADAPAPTAAAAAFAPELPGEIWTVDPASSRIEALAAKVTAKHPIVFNTFQGMVSVAEGKLAGVAFQVDMNSLEADVAKLTTHLKNADFFDVPTYPTSTFVSKEIREGSDVEGMTHTIVGDFSIHGKTKQITFPVKAEVADAKVAAATEFALDRNDFDITYQVSTADNLIQDSVVLTVQLAAAKPGV